MGLRLDDAVVERAFDRYVDLYVTGKRWDPVVAWALGQRAFADPPDEGAGRRLYDVLRRHWLVFRAPSGAATPPEEVLTALGALARALPQPPPARRTPTPSDAVAWCAR